MLLIDSSKYLCLLKTDIITENSALTFIRTGTILDGGATGIQSTGNSQADTFESAANGYNRIRNCTSDGIRSEKVSSVIKTVNNVYAGNGTDEDADAASFGYID